MYLYRSQVASPRYKEAIKVTEKGRTSTFRPEKPTRLQETIGYWWKANQIHGWFVDNVQGGVDECRECDVSRDQLKDLRDIVQEVLNNSKMVPGKVNVGYAFDHDGYHDIFEDGFVIKNARVARKLLPRREGFFFGLYGYDQFYLENLRDTLPILDEALASPPEVTFSYQSSW